MFHREKTQNELLQITGKFDKTVAQKISVNPRNAKYTYPDVQKVILDNMVNMMRDQISGEIFALVADESEDLWWFTL